MGDITKYTNKLQGKNVLVIGGSSGIGYGVTEALLEHGATVVISSSSPDRVSKAVSNLQSSYSSAKSRITGHAYSMGDAATLEANIVELLDKATPEGKLDHIVWTAGDSLKTGSLADISLASVQQAGMVRFFGPILLGKHAPKYLNPGPESSITLTTGAVSEKPIPGWATVGAYATGLHGLTRGFALDLKPIRVNLVSPGAVKTELWAGIPADQRENLYKSFRDSGATGQLGEVEDVAESYIYLMKDKNITGSVISTNSGSLIV